MSETRLDEICDALSSTLNSALYDVGFLKATVNNQDVSNKIGGSFSGHTLDISIRAVLAKTVLFVCRSWDSNGDSLPAFIREIADKSEFIEEKRKRKNPDFPKRFLEIGHLNQIINEYIENCRRFQNSSQMHAARLHRDEILAHNLSLKSGHRKKLDKADVYVEPITYNEVIEASEITADLICEAVRIWTFSVRNPHDTIRISYNYTKLFWSTLPFLSEAESEYIGQLDT